MSEEILINVTPMECRVAQVENGILQELFVERTVEAPALGAPGLLGRHRALCAQWPQQRWPASLRSGHYSSFRAE